MHGFWRGLLAVVGSVTAVFVPLYVIFPSPIVATVGGLGYVIGFKVYPAVVSTLTRCPRSPAPAIVNAAVTT